MESWVSLGVVREGAKAVAAVARERRARESFMVQVWFFWKKEKMKNDGAGKRLRT
jgi:hypothetical protein